MDTDLFEPVAFLCLDDLDDLEQLVEEVLLSGDRRAPQLVLLPALSTHTHAGCQWRGGRWRKKQGMTTQWLLAL